MNDETTLQHLMFKWIKEVNHYCKKAKKVLLVNKCDLEGSEGSITEEMVESAFATMNLDAKFKVSAKAGST